MDQISLPIWLHIEDYVRAFVALNPVLSYFLITAFGSIIAYYVWKSKNKFDNVWYEKMREQNPWMPPLPEDPPEEPPIEDTEPPEGGTT